MAKTKLIIIKALVNQDISRYEFVLVNNIPRDYNGIKEEIKTSKIINL